MTPADGGTARVRPLTRRRTSLLPSSRRKRRERYVGWREPACRIRPLTTASPPARLRHTYTGPVGTSRSRTSRARRFLRRADRAADERRAALRFLVVFVVVVCGVVLAASLPPPPLPSTWPSAYSPTISRAITASTAHPRPLPTRRRRRRSRAPGGRIGCISTSDSRSWRSLYSSMSSLPSSPSASAYVRRKLLT